MKKIITTLTLGLMLFVFFSFSKWNTTPIYLDITKNWPKPVYDFSKNPLTEEGFQLGRNLFYDPIHVTSVGRTFCTLAFCEALKDRK